MRVVPPAAGPEEDLARLRRSPGPWLHLLDAAPADARQLGWMLRQDGVEVRIVRGHCGRSTYGLLDEVGAALQLPGDPADDWPALGALLTDMSWLPAAGHVLVVTSASLLLAAEPAAELRGLVDAVRDVARGRAEEGDPVPFHVVLQDDGTGLAVLRERLDAIGARYAELSEWDAEEPSVETGPDRSSYLPGQREPDAVDAAAAAAVSGMDGVSALLRAWEEFRGPAAVQVRVYGPVLAEPERGPEVAAAVARAVAGAGAACVVVPLGGDELGPRQRAVADAGTPVWPPPEPAAEERPPAQSVDEVGPAQAAPPEPPRPGPEPPPPAPEPPPPAPEPAATARAPAPAAASRPGDRPGTPFELVAANLEWTFDSGSAEADAVDAALVERAASSGRIASLFRTWVRDPAGSWVRVILAYVGPRASIAEVEGERSAIVDALQAGGAARCCVEVLGSGDIGDVHRWLEERCRSLWPASSPVASPAGSAATSTAADAVLEPGPAADDPEYGPTVGTLVAWASELPEVAGLVTAWTGNPKTLVVGVAIDAAADPEPLRAEAAALAPGADIVPFQPGRGLDPVQLRLVRSSTRVWTRRTERGPEPRPGDLAPPAVTDLGPTPERDTDEPRGDVHLDGCTLVGIDRGVEIVKGPAEPDQRDAAVVAWARDQPYLRALLRGLATVDDEQVPVYCLAVADSADPEAARRGLAAVIAATGTTRAAAEAFAPSAAIPTFYLDLVVRSTRLWSAG